MSESIESLISHLYQRNRDSDGTPNCGEEDYHYVEAYNQGVTDCKNVLKDQLTTANKRIDVLEKALKEYQFRSLIELPDEWSYAKEGGGPSIDDCEEVENYACEALAKSEELKNTQGGHF